MSKYTILWEVDDSYVGGSRPQQTVIETDFFDEFMDEVDIAEEIEAIVEEDFQQKISFSITSDINSITDDIKKELSGGED